MIRAGGVSCGALQNFHAHRGVSAGVTHKLHFDEGEFALFITAYRVIHPDRMALGAHADRFIAGEAHLHRLLQQVRCQRRMSLHAHIFLAAKAATVGHQGHAHLLLREAQKRGNLLAIIVNALAL